MAEKVAGDNRSKRRRKTFAMELPSMGLQFCVGDIPLPTSKHDSDEERLLIKVVCGNRHKATT
jgi:hypothetical protein